nr:hypothetical protein [Tanacetum cinerariifolium]
MEEEDQEIIKSINETPAQKAAKRRKLSEEAQEAEDLKKRLEVVDDEDDDVFIEATPLARKTMFKKPDGQDAVWKSQRSVHGLALVKSWKLLTSCSVHIITLLTIQLILLVKRIYPLSRFTLEQLVNVTRLQVEEESKMSLELLRNRLEVVDDEDDDVFVEATPLARNVPVVDYQIVLVDNKPRFKIIKADETHQLYISFTTLLKNFDREDLENLWRIVKERFSTSKPTIFSDEYLLLTIKTMFEKPDEQDAVWKNQKSVHGLALKISTFKVHTGTIGECDKTLSRRRNFTTLLKNFDREDLENLWRIVKDIFSTSKPTNCLDEYLLLTLKTMFEEPDGQDAIWRNQKSVHGLALVKRWKLLTSNGVHVITLSTV